MTLPRFLSRPESARRLMGIKQDMYRYLRAWFARRSLSLPPCHIQPDGTVARRAACSVPPERNQTHHESNH